jgi:hypothetical protein
MTSTVLSAPHYGVIGETSMFPSFLRRVECLSLLKDQISATSESVTGVIQVDLGPLQAGHRVESQLSPV